MAQTSTRGRPYRRLVEWAKANLPWVCHRCWLPISPDVEWPHPKSWSLDHRVPVSRGGSRLDRRNAQPMHLGCNASKGARPDRPALPAPSRTW